MTDVDVIMSPDGTIRLNATNGTFEEGAAKIQKLAELLQAQGIPVEITGPAEAHRHDDAPAVKVQRHA